MSKNVRIGLLDIHFSKLIRIRDLWTCQHCQTEYGPGQSGLHCSHLVGRANKSTRWDQLAAVAHCTSCHFHLGANPIEFTDWIESYLGSENVELLLRRARLDVRWTAARKEELRIEMLRELARAKRAAMDGAEWFAPHLSTVSKVQQEAAALLDGDMEI